MMASTFPRVMETPLLTNQTTVFVIFCGCIVLVGAANYYSDLSPLTVLSNK